MKQKNTATRGFGLKEYLILSAATLAVFLLCVCVGSVNLPLADTLDALYCSITGNVPEEVSLAYRIIQPVRLPRVLCVALSGAALSLCGASMQGLLKNPLADGSTLGVSAGASLGAISSIAFGFSVPGMTMAAVTLPFGLTLPSLPFSGTMVWAITAAFVSLLIILTFAYRLDSSLSTNTIILIGIVYSMLVSALSNLVITFAGEKVKTIAFWNMGSLQGTSYPNAAAVALSLLFAGGILLLSAEELNAFSIGEDNARSIGVNVRRVRLRVLICASVLIGVCVSIGGNISFVGLVTPHLLRPLTGPNHKRLLPASLFGGAIFLLFADLAARTVLTPREIPIGVVTSIVGSILFVVIFYRNRTGKA